MIKTKYHMYNHEVVTENKTYICGEADFFCSQVLELFNSRQHLNGPILSLQSLCHFRRYGECLLFKKSPPSDEKGNCYLLHLQCWVRLNQSSSLSKEKSETARRCQVSNTFGWNSHPMIRKKMSPYYFWWMQQDQSRYNCTRINT